jgi:hypothetical protein
MSSPRPQLTIASIGVSPTPINVTIISSEPPIYRDNGGDLQKGDRWFDTETGVESLFILGEWTTTNNPVQPK